MSSEHPNPEYHIVMGFSKYELINNVKDFIADHWRPIGSIAIIQHTDGAVEYLQPLMRWPKKDPAA